MYFKYYISSVGRNVSFSSLSICTVTECLATVQERIYLREATCAILVITERYLRILICNSPSPTLQRFVNDPNYHLTTSLSQTIPNTQYKTCLRTRSFFTLKVSPRAHTYLFLNIKYSGPFSFRCVELYVDKSL